MNMKINTICFLLLLFFLISAVNAADSDNETLQTINQPDPDQGIDNSEKLQMSSEENVVLKSTESENELSATQNENKLTSSSGTKVTIKAPNVKMYYKDGTQFKVKLKNSKTKKVIKNAKVRININGMKYTKTTNIKGIASFNLNFNSGKYSVLTYCPNSKYSSKIVKSTVTIKSTLKCNDLNKYYKNPESYHSTFYDKKGKLLKNTMVKFKLNSNTYSVKTDNNGVATLGIDLKPGQYSITSINSKTTESVTKLITINTIMETSDLTMNEDDGKFSVKVLDSYGHAASNKIVIFKVDGKTYTSTSDNNGIATLTLNLQAGKYSITTEYEGLSNTNQITVNNALKKTPFSHVTLIPNYVNVTTPYVFKNTAYALKTGIDGIIRMPKNEIFTIQISETKGYVFSQAQIPGVDTTVIGYKTHLIPFDGSGVQSEYNRNKLTGNGILISTSTNYTQIEFRSDSEENTDMFGVYMDKGLDHSETITYLQNNRIRAMINFYTYNYDELGLKNNLAKFYGKTIYDFNYKSYDEITNNQAYKIKFANTNESVTFNYFGKSIVGYPSKEDIITKFIVNGKEELEKSESISYGLSSKYRSSLAFEVLQAYTIINQKVTQNILQKWVDKNPSYISRFGIMNVYGMFLAGLETAWIADEIADNYAKEFGVSWKRENTTTILGGINLDDTYLHILNADMGMGVSGNSENVKLFRLMNSIYLPNIEDYVLQPVAERYLDDSTNSIDTILSSIDNNQFSIVQMGDIFYILTENNSKSAIVINSTSGVSNVIVIDDNFAYKGAKIQTTGDCCSVGLLPKDILKGIMTTFDKFKNDANNIINDILNKAQPLSVLGYMLGNLGTGIAGKLVASGSSLALASTVGLIMGIHSAGNYIKNNFVDKKDWHWAYEHITFTRDGYMQKKKFYNIPKNDGTYDYIEVGINDDGSLNRNDVLYVTNGKVEKISKSESYKYFSEETWTPYSIPSKYQKFKVS